MTSKRAAGKYQLLDPLSPEDFKALEQDILERGVLIPIELDEDGNVIDGHHRKMICEKHGIEDYPTIVRKGWTEEQKRTHSRRMNLARRHLTRDQKRALIEQELRENPDGSNRKIAKSLGVDHKTVGTVREKLVERGEIPQQDAATGIDGKRYISARRSPRPEKQAAMDSEGNAVPDHLADVFRTMGEHTTIANMLTDIKSRLVALGETSAAMKDARTTLKRDIERLIKAVQQNAPLAVHSDCDGAGCEKCHGRGYVTGGETPHVKARGPA